MNIEDIKKALDIVTLLNQATQTTQQLEDPFLGKYVVVRTYSAGNFAGTLKQRMANGSIILENSRRLWRWQTANNGLSLSEVATFGLNYEGSKICCVEPLKEITPIEIILVSGEAKKNIEGAPVYVAK